MLPDHGELAAVLSVIVGLVVGALFGAIQGYFIAFHNVPSFIVTLGGMFVLTGLILLVTEGKTIPANQPEFAVIAQAYIPPWWRLAPGGGGGGGTVLEYVPGPPAQTALWL